MLAIGITNDAVQFVFHDIPKEAIRETPKQAELRSVQKGVTELEQEKDHSAIVAMSDTLLLEINQKLRDLANTEISLLRLKQKITRVAHESIRESIDEDLQRQILYSTIGEENKPDVNQLSEMLDAREREINDAIKSLKRRLQNDAIFGAVE